MSDNNKGFMASLDEWSEIVANELGKGIAEQFSPDLTQEQAEERYQAALHKFKASIRGKVLQSYHNGQGAGPRRAFSRSRR